MRFFKGTSDALNSIRGQVMLELEQPNGRANEPWREGGMYNDGAHGYVALSSRYTTGDFANLFERLLSTPGVEEIDEATYRAAMPKPEKMP